MSVGHYENFPVASIALPPALRRPVGVIYRFARSADDIADEGSATDAERIEGLERYRTELKRIALGHAPEAPLFVALAGVVRDHALPLEPFFDLLDAFEQDVTTKRYATFDALLDYCRRSANPVGALMLALYGAADRTNLRDSDHICSGLQLINFWQDVAIDYAKGRIYIPREDLARFGVSEAQIAARDASGRWPELMRFETDRAGAMLESGAGLATRLPGRIGLELRLIVQGGRRIVEKLRAVRGDVYTRRPMLRAIDWPLMLARALAMRG